MALLTIQTPGATVRLQSDRLLVSLPDASGPPEPVHLLELERVVLHPGVQVSTPALCELLRRQVPVTFVSGHGRVLGSFEPPQPPRGSSRLLQYQRTSDPSAAITLARQLVQAKIANGRRLLQRLDANHHRLESSPISALTNRERAAGLAPDLPSLLGEEGAAAATYFDAWARFLPAEFPFGERSTRPPKNPVNACLSYVGALVYGELLTACVVRGLDPALGCLHQSEDDRWSLPLDLMEPFRPALIEPLTLRLFSHRILQAQHFEPHETGVWLSGAGRRELLSHYEHRVQREFYSEAVGHRTTLRQQLQNAAVRFKLALTQPALLAPFRLN